MTKIHAAQDKPALTQLEQAESEGLIVASQRVRPETATSKGGYMVLSIWGADSWAVFYYNADIDSFEFGRYTKDIKAATSIYNNRLAEYFDDYTGQISVVSQ